MVLWTRADSGRAIGTPIALFYLYRFDSQAARPRSGNERTALLLLRFVRGARRSRQLQHGRVLTFAQSGEQNDLSVGKLERVVVHRRLFQVDLPKPS